MERTYDDIINLMLEDTQWDCPQEERAWMLADLVWTLLDL